MRLFSLPSLLLVALVVVPSSVAQPVDPRPPAPADTVEMAPVVVTATRTAKELEDVAVPTTVVPAETMRRQGAVRLSDALANVPGLALFDDHGTGLQVQGFDPDYTLVLIDGEPVVGRTAGTLALDRLTVHGVEHVEIVRGPSSSLYGSEALAGVVNLVTAAPAEGVRGAIGLRAGSFATTDLTAEAEAGRGLHGVRLLVNRYASEGYELTPTSFGPTAPAFADYTADLRTRTALSESVRFRLGARLAVQDQEGAFASVEDGDEVRYDDLGQRTDWSLHPEVEARLSKRFRLTATLYGARYRAETRHRRRDDGAFPYEDDFDQRYAKAEAQLDAIWSARHLTSLGAGAADERLVGDRYGDGGDGGERPAAQQAWAFAQHEWLASRRIELSASARLDAHADYAARLTPKLAVLVRPAERVRLRASVGSGFKAPAFRQLYLAFTNAAAGYSVFGTTRLEDGLARLDAEGQLEQVFLDPADLDAIRAESSVAVNVGGSAEPSRWLGLSVNAFFNAVRDLIETQPVAQKTNGQFVYGYFNLARIYTRGVEAEATLQPLGGLDLALGYQFLQARDREVVEALEAGMVFGRDVDGREYRLGVGDYGGLFGRSPHTATLRAAYDHAPLGLGVSLRGRWRSRYGYRDLDGNRLANRADEFVPAYAVFDAAVTKTLALPGPADATLQAGVDNVFGVTRPSLVPSLPGRRVWAALRFTL